MAAAYRHDKISTSPMASILFNSVRTLDQFIGPVEAQFFMMRANEMCDGETPVAAIKAKRIDQLQLAIRQVAMEKGVFDFVLPKEI
jgi:hypothetical protein